MTNDNSIHPRNHSIGNKVKKNTCSNSSLNKRMINAIAGMQKHLETNPHDEACQQRVSNARSRLKG